MQQASWLRNPYHKDHTTRGHLPEQGAAAVLQIKARMRTETHHHSEVGFYPPFNFFWQNTLIFYFILFQK